MGNALWDILRRENVRMLSGVETWQDAVRIAIEPLIEGGYVEPRYVDSVLENTQRYGPYYVLAPGLAVIHARCEQGVLHSQIAVTLLENPIRFLPEGGGVRLLVALAAETPKAHNECLMHLAEVLGDANARSAVTQVKSCEDLYRFFTGLTAEEE